jgi:hypothetical protein
MNSLSSKDYKSTAGSAPRLIKQPYNPAVSPCPPQLSPEKTSPNASRNRAQPCWPEPSKKIDNFLFCLSGLEPPHDAIPIYSEVSFDVKCCALKGKWATFHVECCTKSLVDAAISSPGWGKASCPRVQALTSNRCSSAQVKSSLANRLAVF